MDAEPNHNKPSSQHFRLEELLGLLKSGQIAANNRGYQVFDIHARPDLQGNFSFGPTGFPEIGFGQKFESGFQGWELGERVRSIFKVVKNIDERGNQQIGLQISPSIVDKRHADTFFLIDLTPGEEQALSSLGLAEIEAVVNVRERLHLNLGVSNMQDYTARVDRVVAVQKIWDGKFDTLSDHQSVLIEGEVTQYVENKLYPHRGALVSLRMKNGQTVTIKLTSGYLEFDDGVLETFLPKNPLIGDLLQLSSIYSLTFNNFPLNPTERFSASHFKSTFLVKPEKKRQRNDDDQRAFISKQVAAIHSASSAKQVRSIIGSMISSSITAEATYNITRLEMQRIQQLVDEKITDPNERPLVLFQDSWVMENVRNGYKIDPYLLSRNEFFKFCVQVAQRKNTMTGEGTADCLWSLAIQNLNEEQNKYIFSEAIKYLYPKVVGKERFIPGRYGTTEAVTWESQSLFNETLTYMSRYVDPDIADLYIELIRQMNDYNLFTKQNDSGAVVYSEYEIVSRATINVKKNIVWKDNQWGTEIIGLKDILAAREYITQRELFYELGMKLQAEGWTNEGRVVPEQQIAELLNVLDIIDQFLKR